MLYFSKLRIISISFICLFFIFVASNNLFSPDKRFFDKKINLGLDLQGGSYLLLEITNSPVIEPKLKNTPPKIRTYYKDKGIRHGNLNLSNQTIYLPVEAKFKQRII